MAISEKKRMKLDLLCRQFRLDVLTILHRIQTGHVGGSFSVCEILTVILMEEANLHPEEPTWEGRDRLVLCKGHAAPMLYRILSEKGFFPKEELGNLRQVNSTLQGHPCAHSTKGIDISTGALGFGYGAAVGMAMALKVKNRQKQYVYAVLGDGEINEGVVWEAAMSVCKFNLTNLITIIDSNGVQLDGTCNEIMPMLDLQKKFEAFGYRVIRCDGHDIKELSLAIEEVKEHKSIPAVIIANTVKGKGVSFMEGKNTWHGCPVDDRSFLLAEKELRS